MIELGALYFTLQFINLQSFFYYWGSNMKLLTTLEKNLPILQRNEMDRQPQLANSDVTGMT